MASAAPLRTFPTTLVASAAIGVGIAQHSSSEFHELAEHVLGHPVFTHELGDAFVRMRTLLRPKFTDLPDLETLRALDREVRLGVLAILAERVLAEHGETMSLPKGTDVRTENPLESAARLFPKAEVGVVVPPKFNQ